MAIRDGVSTNCPPRPGRPIGARDARVTRLARAVLNPGLLTGGLLLIRAGESTDVRRNIEALDRVEHPDLAVVEARVREERALTE